MTLKNKIFVILAAAVLLKVVFILIIGVVPITFENTTIANNFIADGEMYYRLDGNIDYNHQFPMYGWILIFFYKVFGFVLLPVQIFQIIINALFAFFVLKIFKDLFPEGKDWMLYTLSFLALFHPLLFYYQIYTVHPVTMDVFMFTLLTYISLRWSKKTSFKNSLILVFVIGVTVLERSTLIFALTPALLMLLKYRKEWIRLILLSVTGVLLFLSPWVLRNYEKTGEVNLTSGSWRYLWVGLQEQTEGTNLLPNGQSYYALFPKDIAEDWSNKSLKQQMDFYKKDYIETVEENPSVLFKMWVIKLRNFYWFSGHSGNESNRQSSILLYKFFHGIVLVLAAIALIYKGNRKLWFLLFGVVVFSLVQSFYYIETRHAMPIQFIFWICAVFGIDIVISKSVKIIKDK